MQTDIGTSEPAPKPADLRQLQLLMAKVAFTKLDSSGREISEANGNAGARVDKWRATMGKKLTGTKKERRLFDTEGQGKEWARQLLMERLGYGKAALALDIRTEAIQCVEKLRPYNATLTQAVEFYIKHATPPGGKKLRFDELVEAFLTEREATGGHSGEGIKATTLKPMRSRLDNAKSAWGKRLEVWHEKRFQRFEFVRRNERHREVWSAVKCKWRIPVPVVTIGYCHADVG